MKEKNKPRYEFIGKTIFFPKEKIIVVGDLHLGYETSLRQGGLEVPLRQFEEAKEELERTIKHVKAVYGKIEKIIFLGDVKHHFNYLASERKEINELVNFLRKLGIDENRVVFIRGNHEKNEKDKRFVDYYIAKDIAFIHGHRDFLEIYDKTINIVAMGHIHPTITLSDEMKIKREKYKCFLVGRFRKKDFIVVPSFISLTEGVSLSEFDGEKAGDASFSIISGKELENFEVFAVRGIGEGALKFGRLGDLS